MKKVVLAFAMLLAAFALAACGGGDDDTTSAESSAPAETQAEKPAEDEGAGDANALVFEADPDGALAFTEKNVSSAPGETTVEFNNPSSVPHNVEIESADGEDVVETDVITGGSETAKADLKPGTYTFFCEVAGHREAGMEGTLTVK
ncbi:MAG TPA: plastocyanin/azurin family copper-binding protein [Solirubrobacterales bacterium]